MNKNLRHFLIYGFQPALKQKSEKIFVRTRIVDAALSVIGIFWVVLGSIFGDNNFSLVVLYTYLAVIFCLWGYRALRGVTYYQLNRQDVRGGKVASKNILKNMKVKNDKK